VRRWTLARDLSVLHLEAFLQSVKHIINGHFDTCLNFI